MRNPFQSWPSSPPARVLIYGDPGTQKTRRAIMQMPGPIAFVDLEVGATWYAGDAPEGSAYLATKSVADVRNAVTFLSSPEGRIYRTVVIDPVTVIWAQLQEGHRARMVARGKAKSPEEVLIDAGTWGRLNAAHGSLMTDILNLPQHVVLTARGKESTDDAGVATGYHMEGQKGVPFLVSTVIVARTTGDIVIKDRSGRLREGPQAQRVNLSVLASASGAVTRLETDDDAAARDARSEARAETPATSQRASRADDPRAKAEARARAMMPAGVLAGDDGDAHDRAIAKHGHPSGWSVATTVPAIIAAEVTRAAARLGVSEGELLAASDGQPMTIARLADIVSRWPDGVDLGGEE